MMKKICLTAALIFSAAFAALAQGDKMSGEKMTALDVTPESAVQNGLKAGAKMPSFTLIDANGKAVKSQNLIKKGNLVLVFYRGAWCPFCNLYLKKLQENLAQIKAAGGEVAAISVENADRSLSVAQKNKVEFRVLSDPNFETARKFGIVYQLPKETDELYVAHGLDLAKYNSTDKPELPLAATYIINQKGEIVYAYLEPDYKKRAEPAEIIENLLKIRKSPAKMNTKK